MQIPSAPKHPKTLTIHNDSRIDPYYWLNERENPETIAYLEAENAYTKAQLAHTEPLQQQLFEEIKGRIAQTDMSVPYFNNGYWYYTRFEEGLEYPIYCRKKDNLNTLEETLLDVNDLAKDKAYFQVGSISVSPDNRILAYSVDEVSRRIYTILFKNLETGILYTDSIANTSGSMVWANDNKTLFYTQKDETLRPFQVKKHHLGKSTEEDFLVFEELDATFYVGIGKSKSENYIFIASQATVSSEYRFIDANAPDSKPIVFSTRERNHEYQVNHLGNDFYILTNFEAKNFRLMKVEASLFQDRAAWKEVIPNRETILLEGIELFDDYLAWSERYEGLTRICIRHWESGDEHIIQFNETANTVSIGTNPTAKTHLIRIGYTSLTTPVSIYDYDMEKRTLDLKKQQEVIGGYSPSEYQSERIFAKAADNTLIPISIVYKKGTPINGTAPLLLYGYGSYGHSLNPTFSSVRISLLDRGFVYAIAHIRGGEEMGRYWYEEGKLLQKKNTFTDFIACAEHLIQQKYCDAAKLCAMGGSAGGLLMGAVINLKPELWRAVIAAVPFVDVVTTMLDETIPLTTGEYDEWGNPNLEEYYHYIKSYSPYDNIEAKAYPSLLVTTGLHDSQVQYWEPAKWVAKLRDFNTSSQPVLLFTNMDTGHGGASGRFEVYKEVAMEYAFLIDAVK